jgi:hypothetical protein
MSRGGLPSAHTVCTLTADQVFYDLNAKKEGLSLEEVSSRLVTHGTNELPEEEEEPLWQKFLDKLKEPMIALLMCSAGISLLTGQYHDALSIFIVRWGPPFFFTHCRGCFARPSVPKHNPHPHPHSLTPYSPC